MTEQPEPQPRSGGQKAERSLVLPFVTAESRGGPHDDDSYTAGFECGILWSALGIAASTNATPNPGIFKRANLAQIELMAMNYGFVTGWEPARDEEGTEHDEWIAVSFQKGTPAHA